MISYRKLSARSLLHSSALILPHLLTGVDWLDCTGSPNLCRSVHYPGDSHRAVLVLLEISSL